MSYYHVVIDDECKILEIYKILVEDYKSYRREVTGLDEVYRVKKPLPIPRTLYEDAKHYDFDDWKYYYYLLIYKNGIRVK